SRTAAAGPRVTRRARPGDVDNTPPLPKDELDQVLTCYQAVRKQRPDWLTSQIVSNVLTELKRAKRTQEEEQLYRDAVPGATRSETMEQVVPRARERGDVDGLLKLPDKLEQLPSHRYAYTRGHALQGSANAMSQAMFKRASQKAMADLPRL